MAKKDAKQALMAVLAPDDDSGVAVESRHASLPSLDERVDLYLRAVHGTKKISANERANARLRILDAMADDLAGKADQPQDFRVATTSAPGVTRTAGVGSNIIASVWDVLREALLLPLTLGGGQPMRLAAVSCAALLVAGGAWTATWFYAAQKTNTAIASWIDQEARSGRDYSCGSRSVGGFPLRIEVQCTALQAKLAMSDSSTLVVSAKSLRSVASILDPGALVTEVSGPVSINSSGQAATLVGNWSLARLTLHGQPVNPSQVSVVLDNAEFYRVAQGTDKPVLAGARLEINATPSAGSVINVAAHGVDVSIPDGGPVVSRPFVADIAAVLHDFDRGSPQLLSARLRDWQARGGHLEVASARIQQGDALATGSGQLTLSNNGRIEGALRVSAAGPYQQLAQSYIRDGQSGAGERERLAQSFLGGARTHTRSLGVPQSEGADRKTGPVERQRQDAVRQQSGNLQIPIRIVNGAVYLGSTDLGKIPPLF